MQNELQVFQNKEFGTIRIIEVGGEPWFVGKDVAKALGYERPTKASQDHVDKEDIDATPIQDSIGRMQKTPIINESGLYSLILSSKLSSAKAFKRWVTSEVLPSIRKHGALINNDLLDELIKSREQVNEFMQMLKDERDLGKMRDGVLEEALDLLDEVFPKASYCEAVLDAHNTVPVSVIAKDYGYSAVKFNQLLHECKIQYRIGSAWVLYSQYQNCGYTETITYKEEDKIVSVNTRWTQRGRRFIYDTLKKYGIIPESESKPKSGKHFLGGDWYE